MTFFCRILLLGMQLDNRRSSIVVLFAVAVLLMGTNGVTPVFATFCQISNFTYNYPQQVMPGQNFSTKVDVSGVCAPDDANYYSIRVDLNNMLGQVLSVNSVPIGYSQGQNWTITMPNQVTAPTNEGSWQIQFAVYIFAAVGSGGTLDSVTIKPVTIQVGTAENTQTVSSNVVTTLNQAEVPTTSMTSTVAPTSNVPSLQAAGSDQSTAQLYRISAAFLVIILLVMIVILVKQRKHKQALK